MGKKGAKNCWEYWDCKIKKDCPAYKTKNGDECWDVAQYYCPKVKREFKFCWDCPWFKEMNPGYKR
jgi:hypothetical protein